MTNKLKEIAQVLATWFAVGAAIMLGITAVKYLLPVPEVKVVVCMANELDKIEACKILDLPRKD